MRLISGNEAVRVIKLLAAASKGYKYANKQKVRKQQIWCCQQRSQSCQNKVATKAEDDPTLDASRAPGGLERMQEPAARKGLHQPSAEEETGPNRQVQSARLQLGD